jgi:hypothetical protein
MCMLPDEMLSLGRHAKYEFYRIKNYDFMTYTLRQMEISPSDVQIVEIRFLSTNSVQQMGAFGVSNIF